MNRYICLHGHFYQPPRENPWLEGIELQDSAYPYHDWNERITAECYGRNGVSRIINSTNRIEQIVNNYSRISFNFGPTLLSWMEEKSPDSYQAILAADRESQKIFSGHGSALAQVYNHVIMPLSNNCDKYTQAHWGIQDFIHRFGRNPEGMWLSETAVDLETLDILAEFGIQFTILSPYQATCARKIGDYNWFDTIGGHIDPTTPYLQQLPSGRTITIFFYDGPISQGVAFEKLLDQGENLANRLLGAFQEGRPWTQLVHIATDGETYGHHHRFGEMALSYALAHIESSGIAHLTNYGEFLERHPPLYEVQITENTAWSCYNGVERWRSGRGSNTGMHAGWNQEWRAPLRESLDWLRDNVAPLFERKGCQLLKHPWNAREDYISVILDRSPENLERFFQRHAAFSSTPSAFTNQPVLRDTDKVTILKLMELQRHAMLMYTSCGWFFDELSGIETVQVIQYAGRVIQLAEELFGKDFENPFLDILEHAKSNIPEHRDGRYIYEKFVKPAIIDLQKVGAHYAISSLFETYDRVTKIHRFIVESEDRQVFESGRTKLAVGQARITSEITRESTVLSFGVLHFGDHNLNGGVRRFVDPKTYRAFVEEVTGAFRRADLAEVIRILDKNFFGLTYSLKSLFRDEQRKILNSILNSSRQQAELSYRQVHTNNAPLMHFLADLHIPLPKAFSTATEFVLNADLRRSFEDDNLDIEQIKVALDEAKRAHIEFDTASLSYVVRQTIEANMQRLAINPTDMVVFERLEAIMGIVHSLPFDVDLWKAQNVYYELQQTTYSRFREQASKGSRFAQSWVEYFASLGEKLGFDNHSVNNV